MQDEDEEYHSESSARLVTTQNYFEHNSSSVSASSSQQSYTTRTKTNYPFSVLSLDKYNRPHHDVVPTNAPKLLASLHLPQ